jgi:hypothetical protein
VIQMPETRSRMTVRVAEMSSVGMKKHPREQRILDGSEATHAVGRDCLGENWYPGENTDALKSYAVGEVAAAETGLGEKPSHRRDPDQPASR